MTDFLKNEVKNKRRQDADMFYRVNGAIYLVNIAYFLGDQVFTAVHAMHT